METSQFLSEELTPYRLSIGADGCWNINGIPVRHADWLVIQGKYWYVRGFVRGTKEQLNQIFLIDPNVQNPCAENGGTFLLSLAMKDDLSNITPFIKETPGLAIHRQTSTAATAIPQLNERPSIKELMESPVGFLRTGLAI